MSWDNRQWTQLARITKKLEAFEMWSYRSLLRRGFQKVYKQRKKMLENYGYEVSILRTYTDKLQ